MNQNLLQKVIEAPSKDYPNRSFKIIDKLENESGREGDVYRARVKGCNLYQDVVLKFHKNNLDGIDNYKKFIMSLIEQPLQNQLIKVYDWVETDENQNILVMELGGKNLQEYLQQNSNLSTMKKNSICFQISQSIKFLHEREFMHRDIKPDNFVMVGNEVKLIDFGILREDNLDRKSFKGTPKYQAPEVQTGNYTKKCDIYSLGCVFYEIYIGEPFQNQNIQKQVKNQGQNYEKIKSIPISEEMKDMIKLMLNFDQTKRPDIQQIISTLTQNNSQYTNHFEILISYFTSDNSSKWADDFNFYYETNSTEQQKSLLKPYLEYIKQAKTIKSKQDFQSPVQFPNQLLQQSQNFNINPAFNIKKFTSNQVDQANPQQFANQNFQNFQNQQKPQFQFGQNGFKK